MKNSELLTVINLQIKRNIWVKVFDNNIFSRVDVLVLRSEIMGYSQ